MTNSEIIEAFTKKKPSFGSPDNGARKMTKKLADSFHEDKLFHTYIQHMSAIKVNWSDDIYHTERGSSFKDVTVLSCTHPRLDKYFLDLRTLLKDMWWKVGKEKQKKRVKLLLQGPMFQFIHDSSKQQAEKTLVNKYSWIKACVDSKSHYQRFDDRKLKLPHDGFFDDFGIKPTAFTNNVLVDTKIYFYLLFIINYDGFESAYKRNVVIDSFGEKDYESFIKICQKFIKGKIHNSPIGDFICKYSWTPDFEFDNYRKTKKQESVWLNKQRREFNLKFDELLCLFFIHMTEFCIDNDLFSQTSKESDNPQSRKTTTGTRSNADKGRDFELVCIEILRSKGWTATGTSSSGDQGADIIAGRGPIKLVIQCKDYEGNVGNSAVQEVHAAKTYYDASLAAIVCTKNYTKSAQVLAKNLGVSLWHVSDLENL
ncbi:MAG: hypothetical protein CMM53_12930 [Rhodospirillaceae bacterium]|nr:hypothetical protein [Rhodospirillaceae bacterium]